MFELLFCRRALNIPERGWQIHILTCEKSWGELDYTDGARLDTRVTSTGLSLRAVFCVPNRLRAPSRGPLEQPLSSLQSEIKLGHLL